MIVDSTWSGLVTQKPLALGADIVIHSVTKYINGHGDSLGGAVIGKQAVLKDIREYGIVHLGACISPFNAWLILRGSISLPLRMQKHSQNAQAVADYLESHPKVNLVRYPGLESHPGCTTARKQMQGFSGMLNFNLHADLMAHLKFIQDLKLITHAVSLGHDQSLIMGVQTDFFFEDLVILNERQQEKYRRLMGEGVFRLSVGIEDEKDLIDDLKQALDGVHP